MHTTPQKIIIVNMIPNTVGDYLFLTPLFRALRKRFPEAHLAVTVNEKNRELLDGNPDIDEQILIKGLSELGERASKFTKAFKYMRVFLRTVRELRRRRFDIAIIPQPNFTPNQLIPYFAATPMRIGYDFPGALFKMFLTHQVRFCNGVEYPERHYVESNLDLVNPLGKITPADDRRYYKKILPSEKRDAHQIMRTYKITKPFICMQAGAKWIQKQWPADRFQTLAEQLTHQGHRIVLLGSPSERKLNESIRNGNQHIINLSGAIRLGALCGLIKESALLVGNDSGLLHIASAVGTPSVGIYANSAYNHSKPLGALSTPVISTKTHSRKIAMIDTPEARANMATIPVRQVESAIMRTLRT